MKTAVSTSTENCLLFQFSSSKFSLLLKSYSCPLSLSSHVMCFLFLSTETSFCLKFLLRSLLDNFTRHVGCGPLTFGPWQHLAFGCHGAEAVSVVWATCAGAHGSLINVMYRRNRSGEQEVLAKKKIDRAPLVLGMPCCIKSFFTSCIQIQWHLPTLVLVQAALHAVITNKNKQMLQMFEQTLLPLFLPSPFKPTPLLQEPIQQPHCCLL